MTTQDRDSFQSLSEEIRGIGFAVLLTRGILALLLGLLLLFAPGLGGAAIGVLVVVSIGVWLVFDGFSTCGLAMREKRAGFPGWGWALAGGIAAIVAGVLALIFPLSTAAFGTLMVLWFMAIGLVVRGVLELGDRRLGVTGVVLGILNILFGLFLAVMIVANPASALVALIWVAGVYGVVFGVVSIIMAFRIRNA
ncbi:DUF308 domain-containing protein [Arthrobacter sp. NPDC090010]|uniref:DUF308 domain-containing protein n=1 Tax=Arthrobacter sp. NPDC090010 TaxID=3363942 RepID=UPI003829BD91